MSNPSIREKAGLDARSGLPVRLKKIGGRKKRKNPPPRRL
jgi:uncharacterized protein Veg